MRLLKTLGLVVVAQLVLSIVLDASKGWVPPAVTEGLSLVGFVAIIVFAVRFYRSEGAREAAASATPAKKGAGAGGASGAGAQAGARMEDDDDLTWVGNLFGKAPAEPAAATGSYAIPTSQSAVTGSWVPPASPVTLAGDVYTGGMVYVDHQAGSGTVGAPWAILTRLTVATRGDFRERNGMTYWPGYSTSLREARRAYINWLVDGRKAPDADIGYVFLFFYGLEYRGLIDPEGASDRQMIQEEIRRLLSIYGGNRSFRRYAEELLEFLQILTIQGKAYEMPIAPIPGGKIRPLIAIAAGQASRDGAPLPAGVAAAWTLCDPRTPVGKAAKDNPEVYAQLFADAYRSKFGDGLVIKPNKTLLSLWYAPASRGIGRTAFGLQGLEGIPDVTLLKGVANQLAPIASQAAAAVGPYARALRSGKSTAGSVLLMPSNAWPTEAAAAFNDLVERAQKGLVVLPLQDLAAKLGAVPQDFDRKVQLAVAEQFAAKRVEIIPPLGAPGKPLSDDQTLVLLESTGDLAASTPDYHYGHLMLMLSSIVAAADGTFSTAEMTGIIGQIKQLEGVTSDEHRRLMAQLRLYTVEPPAIKDVRKITDRIPAAAREVVAAQAIALAHADGTIEPEEIKAAQKIYRALGINPAKVKADLGIDETKPVKSGPVAESGGAPDPVVVLDAEKVASLKRESAEIGSVLAAVFAQDEVEATDSAVATAAASEEGDVDAEPAPIGLTSLDAPHQEFVRIILTRPQWAREALAEVAADLGLLLDGALERVNEASFDVHDLALLEGDDPLDVATELLEAASP